MAKEKVDAISLEAHYVLFFWLFLCICTYKMGWGRHMALVISLYTFIAKRTELLG